MILSVGPFYPAGCGPFFPARFGPFCPALISPFFPALTALSNLVDYSSNFKEYLSILNDIISLFNKIDVSTISSSTVRDLFTGFSESLFGFHEKGTFGREIDHVGLLAGFSNFLTEATDLQDALKESPEMASVFSDIMTIITQFTRMVANVSNVAAASLIGDTFAFSYDSIVTSLVEMLTTLTENRSAFDDFFDFAGSFTQSDLSKGVTLFTMLNQLGQTLNSFDSMFNPNMALNRLNELDWASLFDFLNTEFGDGVLNEVIPSLSPTITPVIEITDDFKSKADEMRKALGFAIDSDGNWITPTYGVNIEGIDIPQLNEINTKLSTLSDINGTVNDIRSIASMFNDALSHTAFIIKSDALTEAIGPDVDRWLGTYGSYIVRTTIT